MEDKNTACDNVLCINRTKCYRYFMFKKGEKNFKTFNGTAKKGCGKFIEMAKDK